MSCARPFDDALNMNIKNARKNTKFQNTYCNRLLKIKKEQNGNDKPFYRVSCFPFISFLYHLWFSIFFFSLSTSKTGVHVDWQMNDHIVC